MAPPTDGEMRIQKVDKIEVVYNILSKPKLYNPTAATGSILLLVIRRSQVGRRLRTPAGLGV